MFVVAVFVTVVILACGAHQYLKGSVLKSFATVVSTVAAVVVAFNYFEPLAVMFLTRGRGGEWAQAGSLLVLFVSSFAILRVISAKLARGDIDLGNIVSPVVKVVCGILMGLIFSGVLLTVVALAPLPEKWPYPRFPTGGKRIELAGPVRAFLNPDGFVCGLFRLLSKGSFSSGKSFAVFHPDFLNQIYLNRFGAGSGVLVISASDAVAVAKEAVWQAPDSLTSASTGERLQPKARHSLIVVRVAIKQGTAREGGASDEDGNVVFTPAQLRLVCKLKAQRTDVWSGSGIAVHPVGYMKARTQVQLKGLGDDIHLQRADFTGKSKTIDFVFEIPADCSPVILQFRQNALAEVPLAVPADQAPPVVPFVQTAKCAVDLAEVNPATRAVVYGRELTAGEKLLQGLSLFVSNIEQWQQSEQPVLGRTLYGGPERNKIVYARAAFVPSTKAETRGYSSADNGSGDLEGLAGLLAVPEGYKLLSLKCNNPAAGKSIKAELLPVLIDSEQRAHYAVGLVAAGRTAEQDAYQLDYCCLTAEQLEGGFVIGPNGAVAKPFGDLWLAERVRTVTELYVLYLVPLSSPPVVITAVQPVDSAVPAGFTQHEGFLVK
jgi:uncharacterized membrane protein required for colicin V production